MSLVSKIIYALMGNLQQRRMIILGAINDDSINWEAAFMGLLDGTLTGDIVVANGVTKIKDYSFARCSGLTSIALPKQTTVSFPSLTE